jgi:probable rRNA maturation factor
VQVEVNVQDNFFSVSPSVVTQADNVPCPISTATWESWFYQWLEALQSDLPAAESYELSLRLTNDREIQEFNAQYRQKNQPTDVLAFAALEVDSPQIPDYIQSSTPLYLGDLVLSVDTACRQAREQGHSLQTELAWLTTHGLLHLLGWDHPDEESLKEMLNQQEILIQMVDLSSL